MKPTTLRRNPTAIVGTLIVVAAIAACAASHGAEEKAKPKRPSAETPRVEYLGKVIEVDAKQRAFTIDQKGKKRALIVSTDAEISNQGSKADFNAITVGTFVSARISKRPNGKSEARVVEIERSPGKRSTFAGGILAVDASKKTFTCHGRNSNREIYIRDDSVIMKDGKKADFSAIRVNELASGRFIKRADGWKELDTMKVYLPTNSTEAQLPDDED